MENLKFTSTGRVQKLRDELYKKGEKDRSSEWFCTDEFENIAKLCSEKPVIIRKAHAINEMLTKMTEEKFQKEHLLIKLMTASL